MNSLIIQSRNGNSWIRIYIMKWGLNYCRWNWVSSFIISFWFINFTVSRKKYWIKLWLGLCKDTTTITLALLSKTYSIRWVNSPSRLSKEAPCNLFQIMNLRSMDKTKSKVRSIAKKSTNLCQSLLKKLKNYLKS